VAADEEFLRHRVHKCDCSSDDCDKAPVNDIKGVDLPSCPYSELRTPQWHAICRVANAAAPETPLTNWPDSYPAWVEAGVVGLRSALADRYAREHEEAVEKARRGL